MAYKIYAGSSFVDGKPTGGNVIHDIYRESEFRIADEAKIDYHASLSPDVLTFTLSPKHPHQILDKFRTSILVTEDGELIFRGRIVDISKDFYNRITYKVESDKAFLCDSIVRPFAFTGSITKFLQMLINNHNEMVVEGNWRNFKLGQVTVTDVNDYIIRSSETPMSTFACINDKLIKLLGGYIKIRRSGDDYYIDYLADFTENSGQKIEFGVNLLDIEQYTDASSLVNCLYPYGTKIESDSSDYMTKEEVLANAQAGANNFYHGNHVTISSANNGVDVILNSSSVATYGRVWGVQEWTDVGIPSNLLTKANAVINSNTISTKITVTAMDLHGTDTNIQKIGVGQYVRCVSVPHEIDLNLTCTDVTLDLMNPDKHKVKLGTTIQSLTGSVSRAGSLGNIIAGGDNGEHKCDRAIALTEEYAKLVYDEKHAFKVSASGASAIANQNDNNGTTAYIDHSAFDVKSKTSGATKSELYGGQNEAFLTSNGATMRVAAKSAYMRNGDGNGCEITADKALLYKAGAGVLCESSKITAYSSESDGHGKLTLNSSGAKLESQDSSGTGCGFNATSSYSNIYGGNVGFKADAANGAIAYAVSSKNPRATVNGNSASLTATDTATTTVAVDGVNAIMQAGSHYIHCSALGAFIDGKRIVAGSCQVEFGGTRQTNVAFGTTFSKPPIVITSQPFSGTNVIISDGKNTGSDCITKTGFTVSVTGVGTQGTTQYREMFWIAIGE